MRCPVAFPRLTTAILLIACACGAQCHRPSHPPENLSYDVIRSYPHDSNAFTQGLVYVNGVLYESTGTYGQSSLRAVELQTGRVLQKRDLDPRLFGEGLASWKSNLIQLTWQAHTGFVYDQFSFRPLKQFEYQGEGWGLTTDGKRLILSDGKPYLRFLDPTTFLETGHLLICADGQPLSELNELEYISGQVLANVWHTDRIARISLRTGQVTGWLDLHELALKTQPQNPEAVLNGIAYDPIGKRIFVTGKLWPKLYEITMIARKK